MPFSKDLTPDCSRSTKPFEECCSIIDACSASVLQDACATLHSSLRDVFEDKRFVENDEGHESLVRTILIDSAYYDKGDRYDIAVALATYIRDNLDAHTVLLRASNCLSARVLDLLVDGVTTIVIDDMEAFDKTIMSDLMMFASSQRSVKRVVLIALYSSIVGHPSNCKPSSLGVLQIQCFTIPTARWSARFFIC